MLQRRNGFGAAVHCTYGRTTGIWFYDFAFCAMTSNPTAYCPHSLPERLSPRLRTSALKAHYPGVNFSHYIRHQPPGGLPSALPCQAFTPLSACLPWCLRALPRHLLRTKGQNAQRTLTLPWQAGAMPPPHH